MRVVHVVEELAPRLNRGFLLRGIIGELVDVQIMPAEPRNQQRLYDLNVVPFCECPEVALLGALR